ncbi:MAG: chemotaxis response regulator protein-glutamate methylesterase [Nitrospira sp.]|nr:chemotaxis response regulator protein-glutamate methylesterase [Nitrospira sp.]
MAKTIQVLIVDDSTFMRKSLSTMLASDTRIAVSGSARNGEEAIQQVKALKPDVVTMDVEMPGMNGIEAVKRIMAEFPVPIIMVSSLTTEGAIDTLKALEYGAVDYIPKQLDGVATNIVEIQTELISKILGASQVTGKLAIRRSTSPMAPIVKPAAGALSAHSVSVTRGNRIVAIGCSTGGPQALMEVLPMLPADFPAGIVIVQHMPKSFTKPFADRMNQICPLVVKEAADGDEIVAGRVLIAPGGMQFRVKKKSITTNVVSLSPNYEKHLHAPAADVMLQSVAQLYGERGIGVILTGMGHDGLEGMKAIKASKGRTIAQDEKTCIVYGMPKAVVEAGCADKVVPLPHIVGEILNMV